MTWFLSWNELGKFEVGGVEFVLDHNGIIGRSW